MSEEIIEKLKICLKDENSVVAFLKKISKIETLKNIRAKCNKITENFQFYDGDDALDLESESTLEVGDIINDEGKIFIKSKEKPKKESLDDIEKGMIKSLLEKDLTLDDILFTLRFAKGSNEENLVKSYLNELAGELKPIPNNLTELFVKIDGDKLPCYQYPEKEIRGKKYYTLLVMGETGSGKTTLLDAFVNYLAGMKYEDKWRYKLVNENNMKDKHTKESQTTEITNYYVNYERNEGEEINIRIIDTPGLGDTKGVLQDNKIIKNSRNYLKKLVN
jgi:signal recognition particle GTPase